MNRCLVDMKENVPGFKREKSDFFFIDKRSIKTFSWSMFIMFERLSHLHSLLKTIGGPRQNLNFGLLQTNVNWQPLLFSPTPILLCVYTLVFGTLLKIVKIPFSGILRNSGAPAQRSTLPMG